MRAIVSGLWALSRRLTQPTSSSFAPMIVALLGSMVFGVGVIGPLRVGGHDISAIMAIAGLFLVQCGVDLARRESRVAEAERWVALFRDLAGRDAEINWTISTKVDVENVRSTSEPTV